MNDVDVEAVRRKAIRQAKILFVIFLVLAVSVAYCSRAHGEEIKPSEKPVGQVEQKSQDTEKSAPEKKDLSKLPIKEKIKAIRERATANPVQLEFDGTSKISTLSVNAYVGGGLSIDIELRDGRKSLFFFRGKVYNLELTDIEGDGIVDTVSFSYKNNSEYGSKDSVRRSYKAPFTPAISEQSAKMFNLAVDYAIDGSKIAGSQLFQEFDLQKFFDDCVKASVLERLKQ